MAHVKESVLLFPLRHYRYIYYRSSFKAFAVVGKNMWRRRWQAQAWQKSMNVLCTKVKNTVDMHGKHVFSFVTPCRENDFWMFFWLGTVCKVQTSGMGVYCILHGLQAYVCICVLYLPVCVFTLLRGVFILSWVFRAITHSPQLTHTHTH